MWRRTVLATPATRGRSNAGKPTWFHMPASHVPLRHSQMPLVQRMILFVEQMEDTMSKHAERNATDEDEFVRVRNTRVPRPLKWTGCCNCEPATIRRCHLPH